jgi:hypothetical protein
VRFNRSSSYPLAWTYFWFGSLVVCLLGWCLPTAIYVLGQLYWHPRLLQAFVSDLHLWLWLWLTPLWLSVFLSWAPPGRGYRIEL